MLQISFTSNHSTKHLTTSKLSLAYSSYGVVHNIVTRSVQDPNFRTRVQQD